MLIGERFQVLEMSKPVMPELSPPTTQNLWQSCPKMDELAEKAKDDELNPLEALYAEQLKTYFKDSQMVAYFHDNSMKHENRRKVKLTTHEHTLLLQFLFPA